MSAQKGKMSLWLQEKTEAEKREATRRAEDGQEMLTTVFVRTSETLTNEMLVEYGGTLYAQLGDISIITIPLSQVGKLTENPAVLRLEANGRAGTMDGDLAEPRPTSPGRQDLCLLLLPRPRGGNLHIRWPRPTL